MIEEVDLLLEATEPLPEGRTPRCRELPPAALALVDDLSQADESPAAALGAKGGSVQPASSDRSTSASFRGSAKRGLADAPARTQTAKRVGVVAAVAV
jgi:hypothetical protein